MKDGPRLEQWRRRLAEHDLENLLSAAARQRILRAHGQREVIEWQGEADSRSGFDGGAAAEQASVEGARIVLAAIRSELIAADLPKALQLEIMREQVEGAANSKEFSEARTRALQLEFANELTWPIQSSVAPPSNAEATTQREERARIRQGWMDERHPGWSLTQWEKHTGIAYKTLKKYRNGVTTSRTRSIRGDLAGKESVEFSTVPE